MSTISHIALGYLTSRFFVANGWLPHLPNTYLSGLIFANLPDIDGIIAPRHLYSHHDRLKTYSHYPSTWIGLLSLVSLAALPFRPPFLVPTLVFIATNILGHFFLDTFALYGGIAWLGPWNKKKFSFIPRAPRQPTNNRQWALWYIRHWVIYVELVIWIVALVVFLLEGTR